MSVARVRALRGLQSALRSSNARAVPRVSAPTRTQLAVGRRWASDGGHGHAEPSSDVPWLVGAVVVTIPACWYLWPSSNAHAEHDAHGSHGEEAHDEEPAEDAPKEEGEAAQEAGEQKDDQEAKETEAKGSTQGEAEDAGNKGSTGVEGDSIENKSAGERGLSPADQGKQSSDDQAQTKQSDAAQQSTGNVAADSPANVEERKTEGDSKGGQEKRVDSGLQRDLGPSTETHDDDSDKDRTASAKSQSGDGDISKKQ